MFASALCIAAAAVFSISLQLCPRVNGIECYSSVYLHNYPWLVIGHNLTERYDFVSFSTPARYQGCDKCVLSHEMEWNTGSSKLYATSAFSCYTAAMSAMYGLSSASICGYSNVSTLNNWLSARCFCCSDRCNSPSSFNCGGYPQKPEPPSALTGTLTCYNGIGTTSPSTMSGGSKCIQKDEGDGSIFDYVYSTDGPCTERLITERLQRMTGYRYFSSCICCSSYCNAPYKANCGITRRATNPTSMASRYTCYTGQIYYNYTDPAINGNVTTDKAVTTAAGCATCLLTEVDTIDQYGTGAKISYVTYSCSSNQTIDCNSINVVDNMEQRTKTKTVACCSDLCNAPDPKAIVVKYPAYSPTTTTPTTTTTKAVSTQSAATTKQQGASSGALVAAVTQLNEITTLSFEAVIRKNKAASFLKNDVTIYSAIFTAVFFWFSGGL